MKIIIIIALITLSIQVNAQTWTVPTLKEYVDQRFDSMQEAVNKAEVATEKRFENTNEWRGSYEDLLRQMQTLIQNMRNEYVPRTELTNIERQMSELKAKIDKYETLKAGGSNTLFIVIAIISSLAAALAFSRNFIASIYRQNIKPDGRS